MNLTNVFDGYRQKVLELLQKAYDNDTSNNTNVQSLLQLILADLDLKANLDEIQPTALYIVKDGTLTPVELDSSAPYTNVPIPVVITDINGSAVVNVTAGDLYVNIRHDGTDPSSVKIGDGTEIMLVNADGSINVAASVTGATTPTDDFVTPTTAMLSTSFGMMYDGATWDMLRGTSADGLLVNLGSNNDVVVSATNLDIRGLTHVSDSIKVGDGTEFLLVNADGSINVVTTPVTSTPKTPTKSTVVASGSVASGARSVSMRTSSDFTGSILGDTALADSVYSIADNNTLSAIAYVITTGSIEILEVR